MDAYRSGSAPDFKMLFEAAPGLYLVLTPDLRIVAASDAYLRATMTVRPETVGRPIFDVFPDNPEDRGATGVRNLRDSLMRVLLTGQPDTMAVQKYDIRRPASEGGGFEERFWSPINSPVTGPDGAVRYIIHKVEDVTEFLRLKRLGSEREKATQALRTRAGRMEAEIYLRSQQLGEANRQLRLVNDGLGRLCDQVAALMTDADAEPPDHSAPALTPAEMLGRLEQLIAARHNLEEQLRQAHKMEAVGRLAGGVAHDFNNLLTVINGYVSFAQEEVSDGPALASLKEIEKAAARAASLTMQLLAFSRKQMLQPRVLDCNAVVAEMENLLRRLISENISLVTVLGGGMGTIRVDRGQLEQVIMNLAVNARDAMPHGGQLIIETNSARLDYEGQVQSLAAGPYVSISVIDTGHGMDADTAAHIFEPFFTTKEIGRGTGLGLSTVQGIVEQSGGAITLETAPGKGTVFRVYLPALAGVEADEPERPLLRMKPSLGSVLIVEDETGLRRLVALVLKRAGYHVLEAANGAEALVLAQTRRVDLLLTDVVMPGMTGPELADRLLRTRGDLSVLYTSGYDHDLFAKMAGPGPNFLPKPFTPEALLSKIAELIGSEIDRTSSSRKSAAN